LRGKYAINRGKQNASAHRSGKGEQEILAKATTPRGISAGDYGRAAPFHSGLPPLLFLAGIFFLNFLSRIILAPLLVTVEQDLHLSHGGAGGLFLLISSGYCVTLAGSGFLSARISHRATVICSALALGMALLAASMSHSLAALRIGLFCLGLAAGFYLPSGIATITDLIAPRHWGKAVAIHELAPNLGFVVAPVLAEALGERYSWRWVLALLGVAAVLMGLVYARFGRGGAFNGETPSLRTLRLIARQRSFWILTLLFSLAIGASMGVYAMIPLYLITERGLEPGWANTVVALSRMVAMATGLLGGWVVDRMGEKPAMGGFLSATGVLTVLLGLVSDSWIVLTVFMQAMLAVCFFPAGFAAISRLSPERTRNVAVSLVIPAGILIGAGLVPTMLGLLGEARRFYLGFVMIGVLLCVSIALLPLLKFPGQARSAEPDN
jgi:NNP family nitrate/nitrite transporter-like MFS transporter